MKKITSETVETAFSIIKVVRDLVRGDRSPKRHEGRFDEYGRELVDSRPMEPPVGYEPSPSIAEMIQRMVQSERIKAELAAAGEETFEEADDFDVGDDYDPSSPYEERFYSEEPLEVMAARDKGLVPKENGGSGGPSGAPGGAPVGTTGEALPQGSGAVSDGVRRAIDALSGLLPSKGS